MLKVRHKSRLVEGMAAGHLLLLFGLSACHNNPPSDAISVDLTRSGTELAATAFQYNDVNPTISDDGSEVVFVSGRDSTSTAPMSKAYKASWPKGAAPGALARVTTSDIGYEQDAVLSPDGKWVLIKALNKGQSDLYLQSFSGSQAPVAVTNDTNDKLSYQFSPDSKLISWISRNSSAATSQAQVVAIGSGSTADFASKVSVTANDYVVQLFWSAATSTSYTLVAGSSQVIGPGLGVTFMQYTFANAAAAANATGTLWFNGFNTKLAVAPAAAGSNAVIIESIPNAELLTPPDQVPQVGNGLVANPPIGTPISSAPVYVAPSGSSINRYNYTALTSSSGGTPPPGYDILSLSLTSDGSTAFMVGQFFYRCSGDPGDTFGSSLVIAPTSVTGTYSYVNPRLTAHTGQAQDGYVAAYNLASSPCDHGADGTETRVDNNLTQAVVARSSSVKTYRLAYVTRATTHFDEVCNLLAGDPEVWLIDAVNGSYTFYPLSQNQAPISDVPRPGNPACGVF